MKTIALGIGILLLSLASASATTCAQRAAFCMKNGGSNDVCYEPSRMSQCLATGQYTGPSGRVWPAQKGKK
jgi:hypothetical protein